MNNKYAKKTASIKRQKKATKVVRIVLILALFILVLSYFVFGIIYNSGNFSITLDKNLYLKRGVIIYDDPEYKVYRTELYAMGPETYDNISYKWLPDDLSSGEGSHNGDNYLAYSFYIENTGEDVVDYYSELVIDDVVKNVDDAVRIRVYKDDDYVTYAKANSNGEPEVNTVAFENDTIMASDHVENFQPGDIIKYTIVLWLEGSDPDCTDNVLGGEFKAHMEFVSEIKSES